MARKKLEIKFDDTYYQSDSIEHGRLVKMFVKKLANKIFTKSFESYVAQKKLGVDTWLPLLYKERNLYSTIAAAIDEITPIHLSEWSETDREGKARRVDFWCLYKNGENGKTINLFIEVKKNFYCVSEGTNESLSSTSAKAIVGDQTKEGEDKGEGIVDQLVKLKKLKLNWEGDGNAYLGMIITHGYRPSAKKAGYGAKEFSKEVNKLLDGRKGAQLLFSTWILPDGMHTQWSDKFDFVTISTVVLTTQRT